MNQDLKTFLIAIVTSGVTGWLTFWITARLTKRQSARDRREQELADLGNRELNVVRENRKSDSRSGAHYQMWQVNPFWIEFDPQTKAPSLRGWPQIQLTQTEYTGSDGMGGRTSRPIALQEERVEQARAKHEWIVMRPENDNSLHYYETKACSADEAYLFRPTPSEVLAKR